MVKIALTMHSPRSIRSRRHGFNPCAHYRFPFLSTLVLLAFLVIKPTTAAALDLAKATVAVPVGRSGPEQKATAMLVEEVARRSYRNWRQSEGDSGSAGPIVYVGQRSALVAAFPTLGLSLPPLSNPKPEGFQIITRADSVIIAGNDVRGVLFGVGRLLRALAYGREAVELTEPLNVTSAPRYRLRGHQFAYRQMANSYDGWTVPMWEQYLRDVVAYGANAIEIMPPRTDDNAESPHFNLPPMRMMAELSRLAKEYGIELWIWYPALDRDYSDPSLVEFALKEWGDVLRQLPKVDALFIPGGDPGHTPPKYLFPLMEKQAQQLRKMHPGSRVWMSPQGFDAAWMDDFYAIMKTEPNWLEGLVFGPQQRVSVEELRANVPRRYPIRFYPDITHSLNAQYPVPAWDYAFQATLNREPINPRPLDHAAIIKRLLPLCEYGMLAYSEGCNDDVNKCIWSSLAWDPEVPLMEILRDYSRYFIGANMTETFAQGLLALERNWRGPLALNSGVDVTLQQFQAMERSATPAQLKNWRFQMGLYRAYYDATVRARLLAESEQERAVLEELRRASTFGAERALQNAVGLLATELVPASDLRARVFELGEALFQSIHMQLSVPRYRARSVGRGATLDLIDTPLTNAPWLRIQFDSIRTLPTEAERLEAIDRILQWENPGPGGFYDNLGNASSQPHLVAGSDYHDDPAFLRAPHLASTPGGTGSPKRISSRTYAETFNDHPLEMHYPNLDPNARYRLRVIYGTGTMSSRQGPMTLRLVANGKYEVHNMRPKDPDSRPVEFDIPVEATRTGALRLTWNRPAGGGNGRGVQVSEVWLLRMTAP
jgi:hypothetical protein